MELLAEAQEQGRPQRTRGTGRLRAKWLDGKTRLAEFYQEGAAKIRLPDTYDGTMEAVLINTSGGLTGGDQILWQIEAGSHTNITVTTQACERIYRSAGGVTNVLVALKVGPAARLDWLPQETMLFNHGALHRRLDVDLAADSEFVAVETVLLGRREMGERVENGTLRDNWRIRREGKLIHAEQMAMQGQIETDTRAAFSLDGHAAFATLIYCGPRAEGFLSDVRERLSTGFGGGSAWRDKLLVRLSAIDGYQLRKMLIPVISHLRDRAALPKVWSL